MVMKNLFARVSRRLAPPPTPLPSFARVSYSQCGEDMIVDHLLRHVLSVERPSFIDIGCGDPQRLNNTYYFYQRGCRGVCVEPNPRHIGAIRAQRPEDICVEAGVVPSADQPKLTFHIFDPWTLSTFSAEECTRLERNPSYRCIERREVPVLTLTGLFAKHGVPDLLSIDLEGIDDAVLRGTDWRKHRPAAICAETADHINWHKDDATIAWMEAQDYVVYADTHVNTIFVAGERWRARLAMNHA